MVLRSSAWSLPWEKVILMMLFTPCVVDFVNTLLYHLKALQLSYFLFFLFSFPTLSEGYNTDKYRVLPSLHLSGKIVALSIPDGTHCVRFANIGRTTL